MSETVLGNALRDAADTIEDVGDIVIDDYYETLDGAEMIGEICWDMASTIRQVGFLLDATIGEDEHES